ncbi:MAG: aminopeptidase P family protein [Bryobacterales bacterium]|nr:aminopeptidase P family protein [Bryobacterales bacterium]
MSRIQDIQDCLKEHGIPGWLFYDHHLRDPLAYRILQFQAPRTPSRRWFYLIPARGEPIGLVHRIEPTMLDALPGKKQVYSSWQTLQTGLQDLLTGLGAVAMQHSDLCEIPYVSLVDGGMIDLVRSTRTVVTSSADLVQHFEARWTQAQFDTHIEAGKRVDAIRRAAFDKIADALRHQRSLTEFEVAEFIRRQFRDNGLFTDHGPIVAVNANASNPHYEPTPERAAAIRPGDLVLIDMWAKLDQPEAVYYDITWTGYCGPKPCTEILNVFEIVKGARNAGVQFIQQMVSSGTSLAGFEVDDVVRGFIRDNGFGDYFIHRTGHSIGTDVHGNGANMDNLESHDTRAIIANTCFSIEPGIYLTPFGIRSEVNVFVAESSAMVTGEMQEALLTL